VVLVVVVDNHVSFGRLRRFLLLPTAFDSLVVTEPSVTLALPLVEEEEEECGCIVAGSDLLCRWPLGSREGGVFPKYSAPTSPPCSDAGAVAADTAALSSLPDCEGALEKSAACEADADADAEIEGEGKDDDDDDEDGSKWEIEADDADAADGTTAADGGGASLMALSCFRASSHSVSKTCRSCSMALLPLPPAPPPLSLLLPD
jgi:hypothetical protein